MLWNHVPDFRRMYQDLGKRLAGELVCRRCEHREECDEQRAAICLARGWPQHCGETMTLEPLQELAVRAQGEPGGSPQGSGSPPAPSSL